MNRGRIGTLSLMKRQVCSLTGLQVPHPHDIKAPFDSNEAEKSRKEERFDKIESCESALRGTIPLSTTFKRGLKERGEKVDTQRPPLHATDDDRWCLVG